MSNYPDVFRLPWKENAVVFIFPLLLLMLTGALVQNAYWEESRAAEERFSYKTNEIRFAIEQRLLAYEHVLKGGVGLFSSIGHFISRKEWHAYIRTLEIEKNYPGIQGIGFALYILPEEKDKHIQMIRKEGFLQYTIKPEGNRSEYTSIIYLEPFSWRNQGALGFDMFSEPTRHKAMVRARNTGLPSISGKVKLVQESQHGVQDGFLMYLPVYVNPDGLNIFEGNERKLRGYVYSSFRINDFMRGVIDREFSDIGLRIYDGVQLDSNAIMYDNVGDEQNDSKFSRAEYINLDGHTWVLKFSSLPEFEEKIDHKSSIHILVSGTLITFLFTIVVIFLMYSRKQNLILRSAYEKLQETTCALEAAQHQAYQSEKMASIGQLAAGVAHEINNPISYVFSNFSALEHYVDDLIGLLKEYVKYEEFIHHEIAINSIKAHREGIGLDYIVSDIYMLVSESKGGIERVRKIVQDLKDFSHTDLVQEWKYADIHDGIISTLNIVNNEIKYCAVVKKEFGDIPNIYCIPSQINQVFMNILVNAAHAMEQYQQKSNLGLIVIRTGCEADSVWIEIEDNGKGIAPDFIKRIFDPFFTTKPVGKGTGLGLSLSYSIIKKHNGKIEVVSELGKGTCFKINLPVDRVESDAPE